MKKLVGIILCFALLISSSAYLFTNDFQKTSYPGSTLANAGIDSTGTEILTSAEATQNKVATTREELLQPLDNDYRSRTETVYHNINGQDVTVYGLYRNIFEQGNNPNFSQALMIYQCIKYKEKYPDEPVYISVQSFHFSVVLAACVDPTKPDYGHMKNLYDEEYNDDGYFRLSYLLVEAAKKGIEVYVIGQLDASATTQEDGIKKPDLSFVEYFNSHLDDDAYITGKKVSDYMVFGNCLWTCYGDKAAADMMHNKTCTVSNYIDNNGVEHGAALWLGSINIDGVSIDEVNGHDSIQTAVVVTNHEEMRQTIYNFTKLVARYCGQEDIIPFRVEAIQKTNEQIDLILNGRADEIPKDEQIVYLGTEQDSVFELYFTPLGGDYSTWDTVYNPFAKYLAALLASADNGEYIECLWNNVKFNQNYELADIMVEAISLAFEKSGNKNNILHLHLPGIDTSYFDNLVVGENIGFKFVDDYYLPYHTKDLQVSYVENGIRQYVTVLNSLNMHEGSSYHQTNTILVIKENSKIGNYFYIEYAALTSQNTQPLTRRDLGEVANSNLN